MANNAQREKYAIVNKEDKRYKYDGKRKMVFNEHGQFTGYDPPVFESPDDCQIKGELFFEYCEETARFPTVTAFAVFLRCSREAVWNYGKRSDQYAAVLQDIKDRIFDEKYQRTMSGEGIASLVVFDAINNHNMVSGRHHDKKEVDLTAAVTMSALLGNTDQGGLSLPPGANVPGHINGRDQDQPIIEQEIDENSDSATIEAEIQRLKDAQAVLITRQATENEQKPSKKAINSKDSIYYDANLEKLEEEDKF